MAKTDDLVSILSSISTEQEEQDEFLPTGSVILDTIISDGKGFPRRKYIELSAETGLGKTTAALHMCKTLCSKGYICVYIDVEKSVNDSQLQGMGLSKYLNTLFFHKIIDTFEDAEEILDKILVDDERLALICVDSVTALIPRKMMEKSVSELEPGLRARYSSDFLIKYRGKMRESGCKASMLFINQMRTKFDFRRGASYEAAGGSAQKFYADIRLQMVRDKKLVKVANTMEGRVEVPYGCDVKVWAEKNRFARPFVVGVVTVLFGKGISNISAYERWIKLNNYVKTGGGGWMTISFPGLDEAKCRGSVELSKWIRDNLAIIKEEVSRQGGFLLLQESEE